MVDKVTTGLIHVNAWAIAGIDPTGTMAAPISVRTPFLNSFFTSLRLHVSRQHRSWCQPLSGRKSAREIYRVPKEAT
jgi:hypothetical protein